jgi:hypothetical protein
VHEQVDIAGGPGRGILGTAEQVDRLDPEPDRIEAGGNALRHAGTPSPILAVRGAQRASSPIVVIDLLGGLGEDRDGLVELGIHQHVENLAVRRLRDVDHANRVAERGELRGRARKAGSDCASETSR